MAKLFGTGGIRGRMEDFGGNFNQQTVERATQGLADWLRQTTTKDLSVAIAYDTRHHSADFASVAAAVLQANGIRALLFRRPTPTPTLSFAVRHLACAAGIILTASHNPKEDNGYKVYNHQGCQLVPREAEALSACIEAAQVRPYRLGETETLPESLDEAYLAVVAGEALYSDAAAKAALHVMYTPLHGAGDWFVREALSQDGFTSLRTVSTQQTQDGGFPTVKSPNPEDRAALNLAIEEAGEWGDIVLGTDPDCDRVGAAVRHAATWRLINGNQMGALLLDFILRQRYDIPADGAVVKTIVTSNLGADIAEHAGLAVFETLTGFKYIGEMMDRFLERKDHTFVFGYEESYGYLVGDYARDKDAVVSALLICEMTAWHKTQGRTLMDALDGLYKTYGIYLNVLETVKIEDLAKAQATIDKMRAKGGDLFTPTAVMRDYQAGIDGLPPENVLKFSWPDGSWVAVRPSGTEPKMKIYYEIRAADAESAEAEQKRLSQILRSL